MHIIRKNITDGTWSWFAGQLPAIGDSWLRSCGLYVSYPFEYLNNDDPTTDWIDLDEGKELLECGECGCVEPKDHDCDLGVPPTITLPANAYDHSEAR